MANLFYRVGNSITFLACEKLFKHVILSLTASDAVAFVSVGPIDLFAKIKILRLIFSVSGFSI